MKLDLESTLGQSEWWNSKGVATPRFDVAASREAAEKAPQWLHFGAGNIFRGFIGSLSQRLLEAGLSRSGIVACETFDFDIVDKIYAPHDSLTLNVLLNPDGTTTREILAGVACGLKADFASAHPDCERIRAAFRSPSLQMVSFTITEKGYAIRRTDGSLLGVVAEDMANGPEKPRHAMSAVASLLLERFRAGAAPVAMVSMDNCSHNGERLKAAVLEIANAWRDAGFAGQDFIDYVSDESKVSFPWTMIDKITPRPHPRVQASLEADGVEGMEPVVTSRSTYIAAFVNAEKPQYLVVEDRFPNGRPPLEKAGVLFCDRETVNMSERMKVTTCLNPLHTSMAMYGCLFGYTLICDEMKDPEIVKLVRRVGYAEGLPVAPDPKILSPKAFIDEVVGERLPNPFMPDDPRRIATDTSQKVGIRFGETVKSTITSGRGADSLVGIPLAIAGWFRYLLAKDDEGRDIEVSTDPLKDELQAALAGVVWNDPASYAGQLRPILANETIFHLDYTATPLADRIETYFKRLLEGPGAARRLLRETLAEA